MGILRLPDRLDHWNDDKFPYSSISNIMSKNTFKLIDQFFHLANNSKSDGIPL